METETIYVIFVLTTICGFLVGNFTSPSVRFAKKEIGYWRGLTGDFKKQLKSEKKSNSGDLDSLLEGDMSIGKILKVAKNLKPEDIEGIKGLIGQVTSNVNQQKELGDNDAGRFR